MIAETQAAAGPTHFSLFDNSNVTLSKQTLAKSLVFSSSLLLNSLWHEPQPSSKNELASLGNFIVTVLKRSGTSNATLRIALYYLVQLAATVNKPSFSISGSCGDAALSCKRRMFLACLILAYKFTHDKNFSMKYWSMVSGLSVKELVHNEYLVLKQLNFNLSVTNDSFKKWDTALSYFVVISNRNNFESVNDSADRTFLENILRGVGLNGSPSALLEELSSKYSTAFESKLPFNINVPRVFSYASLLLSRS